MRKSPRRTRAQRTWYVALMAAWVVIGSLTASAQTGGGSLTAARPTGQGWFYDRPVTTDPLYNTSLPNQGANTQFGNDHLYVGWDATDQDADKAEAFAAVNFDLFQLGIPDNADITNFKLTMIEHTQDAPNQGQHGTPNATTAYAQGIIACPMPQFIAGTAATPIVNAPPRECGTAKVDGVRDPQQLLIDPAVADGITNRGFAWKFDLTTMARNLVRDEETLSFVFEPKPPADPQNQTWMMTFHNGDYTVANKPLPGVSADIAWVATSSAEETADFFPDEAFSGSEDFSSSDVPSFSDFGGLAGELAPEPSTTEPSGRSRPIAGVSSEGKPADFWDIPPTAWLALILGLFGLFAAGVSLLSDPSPVRTPGAVSALMAGFTPRDE